MRFLLTLSLLLCWVIGFSQNEVISNETPKDSTKTVKTVPQKQQSSGGVSKFYQYMKSSFRVPDDSDFPGGKIIVQFTIKIDGTLDNIKILKDIGYGTGDQIIKILKKTSKWSPGVKDGKPVDCTYTLPIVIPKSL